MIEGCDQVGVLVTDNNFGHHHLFKKKRDLAHTYNICNMDVTIITNV